MVAVVSTHGLVRFVSVQSIRDANVLAITPRFPDPLLAAQPQPKPLNRIFLKIEAEHLLDLASPDPRPNHLAPGPAAAADRSAAAEHNPALPLVTSVAACHGGVLVGTRDGVIACVSWLLHANEAPTLRWKIHLPSLLRTENCLVRLGIRVAPGDADPNVEDIVRPKVGARDDMGGVVNMHYVKDIEMCGVVTGSGVALVMSTTSGGSGMPSASNGRWLTSCNAVSIALEKSRFSASVGLRNGDVDQYYVGATPGERCPVTRTISLSGWYFEPKEVGAAKLLQWTGDGAALAVGWEKKGIAVWSVSGCRLMWTLPQVGGTLPLTPKLKESKDQTLYPLNNGVRVLCWGPSGFFLWASPVKVRAEMSGTLDGSLFEFSFLKSGVVGSTCQAESNRMAMYGSDRILVMSSDGSENMENSWQHLLIPLDYVRNNWPMDHIAVKDDMTHVAVAGKAGIAICNIRLQRWKTFGDHASSSQIRCCTLCWFGETLIIGSTKPAESGKKATFELLFYPVDRFDSSTLKARVDLPSRPMLVDVRADGYLLVLCEDSLMFMFHMVEDYGGAVLKVTQKYKLFLPTRESALHKASDWLNPGGGIAMARIFPPLDQAIYSAELEGISADKLPVPTSIMIMRSTGSLVLLDSKHMVSRQLLQLVEHFWFTRSNQPPFENIKYRPIWWAYGDNGLNVCFREGMKQYLSTKPAKVLGVQDSIEIDPWFDLDSEVYPLGLTSGFGTVLGVSQGFVTQPALNDKKIPSHQIKIKQQPILHTLLRHFLSNPQFHDNEVLRIAVRCLDHPQFVDSLEWLLYEAVLEYDKELETRGEGDQTNYNSLFYRVVRLLRYFGEYEDIVVRCARKMNPRRWPILFSLSGEPAALLEQCFNSGRLRTSACLLVILQEMFGFASSIPNSLRLLEAALKRGELGLSEELANFLKKAHIAGNIDDDRLPSEMQWVVEMTTIVPNVAYVLYRHMKELIQSRQFRAMAAVAVRLEFPLAELLKRERSGKPFLRELEYILFSIHQQFQWPEPKVSDVQSAVEYLLTMKGVKTAERINDKDLDESAEPSNFGVGLPPPRAASEPEYLEGIRLRTREICRQELSYLKRVTRHCPDFNLCFATVLLDAGLVMEILTKHEKLEATYLGSLRESKVQGYALLADEVEKLLDARSDN